MCRAPDYSLNSVLSRRYSFGGTAYFSWSFQDIQSSDSWWNSLPFSLNWFLVIFMEQNLFGTLKKCRNISMLVPLLHSIVHYLLTSFFHVCSWSAVPVGSCAHDIKGFLGVKKPLCKRTNCCLVSENTLEKTLARNLLKEQEKSRSSWRNIWAAVECKEWS